MSLTTFKVPMSLFFVFVCLPEALHDHVREKITPFEREKKVRFHLNRRIVSEILFLICVDSVKRKK